MNKIFKQIEKIGIVPVIVLDNEKDALPLGKALSASGLFRRNSAKLSNYSIRPFTNNALSYIIPLSVYSFF